MENIKPRIVLIMEGGVIQQAFSNVEVEIINADFDCFENAENDTLQHYEDRLMEVDVATSPEEFAEWEANTKADWEADYQKVEQELGRYSEDEE
jgi:hypothetical protein